MIKIENVEIAGWEPTIRGMRNPMNSWAKSDSIFYDYTNDEECEVYYHDINGNKDHINGYCTQEWGLPKGDIGPNDLDLMKRLISGGPVHCKFRRMITVWCDITAPLYWWKEFDTYKVGTVANSCSTMHKIHAKEFELDDFSWDQLLNSGCDLFEHRFGYDCSTMVQPQHFLIQWIIPVLNKCRELYLETKDKKYWWQMIQLLPSSYNQKRTVMLNYEVLANIYRWRKDHKLYEWRDLCSWIETLPYAKELIVCE